MEVKENKNTKETETETNDIKPIISVFNIYKLFKKIYKGFTGENKEQLNYILKEEMYKTIPSDDSEVFKNHYASLLQYYKNI